MTALFGLFLISFLAASLFPAQSEIVLVGLLLTGDHSAVTLVLVATVGNVLGSVLNWFLGRFIVHFRGRKWFPVSDRALARAEGWYHRWGRWSLLAACLPVIGDPLTVVAGVLRERFDVFLALVTVSKAVRYVLLAWATLAVT